MVSPLQLSDLLLQSLLKLSDSTHFSFLLGSDLLGFWGCPSSFCERDISRTPWGNFYKFSWNNGWTDSILEVKGHCELTAQLCRWGANRGSSLSLLSRAWYFRGASSWCLEQRHWNIRDKKSSSLYSMETLMFCVCVCMCECVCVCVCVYILSRFMETRICVVLSEQKVW